MESTVSWCLGLLGQLRLERDGEIVEQFATNKEDQLLAYIALDPTTRHPREAIAAALWPDMEVKTARRNLSYTLHMLRKRLAGIGLPDGIWVSRHTLQLNPRVDTDVGHFSAAIVEAARAESPEQRARQLEDALARYGAGLLPGLDAPWVTPERERLADLYDEALRQLAACLEPAGDLYRLLRHVPPETLAGRSISEVLEEAAPAEEAAPSLEEIAARAEAGLDGAQRKEWLRVIDARYPEIEAALDDHLSAGRPVDGLKLAAPLWRYWYERKQADVGRRYLEQLLDGAPEGTALRAQGLHAAGTLAMQAGDPDHGEARLQQAMAIWQELDDDERLLRTLSNLALAADQAADHERAARLYDQSLATTKRLDKPKLRINPLLNAALNALKRQDGDRARELLTERLALLEDSGDRRATADTRANLACAALLDDDFDAARQHAKAALDHYRALGARRGESHALRLLARTAEDEGALDEAQAQYEAALEAAQASGNARAIGESLRYLGGVIAKQGDLETAHDRLQQAVAVLTACGWHDGAEAAHDALDDITARLDEEPVDGTDA